MRATGLFFLRTSACTRTDPTTHERVGVWLPVVEREKNAEGVWVIANTLTASWKGPEAVAFFDAHQGELRAGRPLHLELDRLHGRDGEWQARVTRLELAPVAPSWRRDEEQPQPTASAPAQHTQPQPAAPA